MFSSQNFSVSLQGHPILHDLTFNVQEGTLTGIVGPNGSGKTTLLRALSGATDYGGQLSFRGKELKEYNRKTLAQHIAFLQQGGSVLFDFSVIDFVLLGRLPHKGWLEQDDANDRRRAMAALTEMEVEELADRTLPSLSGGEQQRVFLAQAMVQDTDVLLLDEPTTHLDVYHQFELLSKLRQTTKSGKTAIAVFHDLSLALRFADEVVVLNNGRLAATGPIRQTLTSDLIRDVFRMESTLVGPANAPTHVHFSGPKAG